MKKFIFALVALMLALGTSLSYAEISATTYSPVPRYDEMVSYIEAYNGSGGAITSNSVVVLSFTSGSNASLKATGAVITTTATANNALVVGVTDHTIADGSSGRICVKGPHKVLVDTAGGALVQGASLATSTTAGYASALTAAGSQASVLGYLINTAPDPYRNSSGLPVEGPVYWVYLNR